MNLYNWQPINTAPKQTLLHVRWDSGKEGKAEYKHGTWWVQDKFGDFDIASTPKGWTNETRDGWAAWFAWYPVLIWYKDELKWVWFRWVLRKIEWMHQPYCLPYKNVYYEELPK